MGAIVEGRAYVYTVKDFGDGDKVEVNQSGYGTNKKLVIAGSEERNFAVAFLAGGEDESTLAFEAVEREGPVIMKDQKGNFWNLLINLPAIGLSGLDFSLICLFINFNFSI